MSKTTSINLRGVLGLFFGFVSVCAKFLSSSKCLNRIDSYVAKLLTSSKSFFFCSWDLASFFRNPSWMLSFCSAAVHLGHGTSQNSQHRKHGTSQNSQRRKHGTSQNSQHIKHLQKQMLTLTSVKDRVSFKSLDHLLWNPSPFMFPCTWTPGAVAPACYGKMCACPARVMVLTWSGKLYLCLAASVAPTHSIIMFSSDV